MYWKTQSTNLGFIEHSAQYQTKYILFKYTQSIPEDISYDAAQNKSANLRKLKSYQISFQTTIYETRNQQEEEG